MSLRLPAADLLRWIAETRALLDRLERGLAPARSSPGWDRGHLGSEP